MGLEILKNGMRVKGRLMSLFLKIIREYNLPAAEQVQPKCTDRLLIVVLELFPFGFIWGQSGS